MYTNYDVSLKYGRDIKRYLKDSKAEGNNQNRELSSNEMAYVARLGQICREFNRTISKINFINLLINYIEDRDVLYPIKRNLFMVSSSLAKQLDLVYAVQMHFLEVKPKKEYIPALTNLVHKCEKRLEYVSNTTLMAAIDLTPLKEYIELVGEPAFNKWVLSLHGCEDDGIKEEIKNVLNILKDKKLDKAYLERLHTYQERDKEIQQKVKEDRQKEREDLAKKVQQENLELLYSSVRSRENEINSLSSRWAANEVLFAITRFPNQPIFFVAIGYTWNGLFQSKILKNDGRMCTGLRTAKIFSSEKDAKDAADKYMADNPKRAAVAVCVKKEA